MSSMVYKTHRQTPAATESGEKPEGQHFARVLRKCAPEVPRCQTVRVSERAGVSREGDELTHRGTRSLPPEALAHAQTLR